MIKLPAAWIEKTEWDSKSEAARGRLGRCHWASKTITYYPRTWMILIWPIVSYLVKLHERGHANGIPDTGCLGGHKWCIMAEEADGVDSWLGKAKMWPSQLLAGVRFCPDCQERIDE